MTPSDPLACAIKDVASAQKTTFATTQAVWRFLNNDRIAVRECTCSPCWIIGTPEHADIAIGVSP
ncbi:hypothetical protein [Photorhabdus cinerea]|uniref:hypothetical protein n=1 Tax=Photorhabdus cinerea TaxID=471575 RepID=UPI00140ABC2B|nr:hypothetical protein [Photorhabdus cinerea]